MQRESLKRAMISAPSEADAFRGGQPICALKLNMGRVWKQGAQVSQFKRTQVRSPKVGRSITLMDRDILDIEIGELWANCLSLILGHAPVSSTP